VTWINQVIGFANANKVGIVVKGRQGGLARGYVGAGDERVPIRPRRELTQGALQNAASVGSELTFTVVPFGSQTRIGIDRDLDGYLDRDELDAGTDPADAASHPGGCTQVLASEPSALIPATIGANEIHLAWSDNSNNEDGFTLERAPMGSGQFGVVASLPANTTSFSDASVSCGTSYDYRVSAYNCAGVGLRVDPSDVGRLLHGGCRVLHRQGQRPGLHALHRSERRGERHGGSAVRDHRQPSPQQQVRRDVLRSQRPAEPPFHGGVMG
jgi:hypothetical protein